MSLESAGRARRFFETALRLDDDNVEALIGFANAHMWEVNMSYASDDRDAQIHAAGTAAKQALALAPDSAEVLMNNVPTVSHSNAFSSCGPADPPKLQSPSRSNGLRVSKSGL